jgi:hypothetical protein
LTLEFHKLKISQLFDRYWEILAPEIPINLTFSL